MIKKNFREFNSHGSEEVKAAQKVARTGILSGFVANNTKEFYGGKYVNKLESTKKSHIIEILNFVNEGEMALKNGNLNTFGELLNESWLAKKGLSSSISNHKIEEIYNFAVEKGALGGKLLGAGGGGFFLFYVPKVKKSNFIKNFRKFVTIPFKFTYEGSQILYKSKRDQLI